MHTTIAITTTLSQSVSQGITWWAKQLNNKTTTTTSFQSVYRPSCSN